MAQMSSFFRTLLGDRIQLMAILVVVCFVSVLLLTSQSRASYPTYLLALLMLVNVRHWIDVFQLHVVKVLIVLLIWLSASAFWSEPFDPRESASVWIRAILVFLFVVAVAECQLRGQLQRWVTKALVIVGVLAMLGALVNFFVTNPADGRLNGLGQLDTHVIAALVYGVVLIFALRLLGSEKRLIWRALAITTIGFALMCVALSDSRTAWVSVTLGALTYIYAHRITDARQLILSVGVFSLIAAVVFLALIANDDVRAIVLPRGDSFRLTIWAEIFAKITQSPLIGLGITTADDVVVDGIFFSHPHNMYFSLLYQGGVVALGIYLYLLTMVLTTLIKNYEHADAKLALSLLILASSAFLLDGHELIDKVGESWFLIWLPVAIGIGLRWRNIEPS